MVCISYAFGSTNILENFHIPNDGGYHTEKQQLGQLLLKKNVLAVPRLAWLNLIQAVR